MNRRTFLQTSLTGAVTLPAIANATLPAVAPPNALPRWRGFNLLEKFVAERSGPYREWDFENIAKWGFDFVRLPMSYRCWASGDPATWKNLNENVLKEVDRAVELGKQYRIHVNLNLHRAPGYCVNPPAEPLNLWNDEAALEAAVFHWRHLAERYKGKPNTEVSFDLLNEPANVDETRYVRVIRAMVEGIRAVDPTRLIVADGLDYGTKPVFGLADLKLGQSTRGYNPITVSHHKASWINIKDWPAPAWPMPDGEKAPWDAARLQRGYIEPWQQLQAKGVGIHVGEWGCFNKTPHDVALRWMEDCLKLWQTAGWGWALWNFRGAFGILNSDRTDVAYRDYKGEKLDEKMLALLRKY